MNQFSVVTWYNVPLYVWGLTGIEVPFPSEDNIKDLETKQNKPKKPPNKNKKTTNKKTYYIIPYIASSLNAATVMYAY